jgi:hypothetical protein
MLLTNETLGSERGWQQLLTELVAVRQVVAINLQKSSMPPPVAASPAAKYGANGEKFAGSSSKFSLASSRREYI